MAELGYDVRLNTKGTLVPSEVAKLRVKVREVIEKELSEIDNLVVELLGRKHACSLYDWLL